MVLLMGCGDPRPLANDPPRLLSLNGQAVLDPNAPIAMLTPTEGDELPMVLEIVDPEGDPVTVWFPAAPPGLDFEPDETEGIWHYTEDDTLWVTLDLVLWDEHPDEPRWSQYAIHLE